ncbi:hypothetical protein [Lyngbya sp. CCY1209]|nr:hypothetical protein [Lyngbya sp. CCY1209]
MNGISKLNGVSKLGEIIPTGKRSRPIKSGKIVLIKTISIIH